MSFDILNFNPKIINNFFTDVEINEIYKIVNDKIIKNIENNLFEYDGFEINKGHGSFMYNQNTGSDIIFPKNIYEKIKIQMEEVLAIELEMPSLCFQRYSLMTGNNPKLHPHTDQYKIIKGKHNINNDPHNDTHLFSLSVPLKNNFNWDILVDWKNYSLDNNDALLFSATADLHCRPHREFQINEKYDVLIVRVRPKNNKIPIDKSKYENIELSIEKMKKATN
jgi:hypothetical protein